MTTLNILRSEDCDKITIKLEEVVIQPSLFDITYWIWKRRQFRLRLKLGVGSFFEPDTITVIETTTESSKTSVATFGIIVQGRRLNEASQSAFKRSSHFDAYLKPSVKTLRLKLLVESDSQNLSLS